VIATVNRLELGRRYERALDAGGPRDRVRQRAAFSGWGVPTPRARSAIDGEPSAARPIANDAFLREANVEHRNRMGCVRWRLFTHCDECGGRAHPITVGAGLSARQAHSRGWSRSIGVRFRIRLRAPVQVGPADDHEHATSDRASAASPARSSANYSAGRW